jgi:endonuclease/exonuclease/phosphatase family metal-dependent hydrolase
MPMYTALDPAEPADRRTAEGLLRLKAALDAQVPARTLDQTLLLATWNIREFDSGKFGDRTDEPLHYIAEVIDKFDLVAVQEVNDDLRAFNRLLGFLGRRWRYLLSDVTVGTAGNRERMAFLYDSSKITFSGLAGEIVLPPVKVGGRTTPAEQLARTPYLVAFQAGWLKFALCTVHIYYGDDVAEEPRRVQEISKLAQLLAARAASASPDSRNTILLGDFNIFSTGDSTLKAMTDAGFVVPSAVLELTTSLDRTKHYDQVAFTGEDLSDSAEGLHAGAFPMYDTVYRSEDEKTYRSLMGSAYAKKKTGSNRTDRERTTYYNQWRTHQMSDHLPLWVEIPIDFSGEYLERKSATPRRARTSARARPASRPGAEAALAPPLEA